MRTNAHQRAVRVVMAFDEHDRRPGRTLAELIVQELREVEAERDAALARAQSAEDELAVARRELAALAGEAPLRRDECGGAHP